MKRVLTKGLQYAIFFAVNAAAVYLLIMIAGEENPEVHCPPETFWLIKFLAIGCAYGLYHLCKALDRIGAFPEELLRLLGIIDNEPNDEEEAI